MDFVDDYERLTFKQKERSTSEREHSALKVFRQYFKNKYLHNITVKDIDEYINERITSVKKTTLNLELGYLKHIFNTAIKWNKLLENPMRSVIIRKAESRKRYLTPEELHRLLIQVESSRSKYIKPIVYIILNTGIRRVDILKLTPEDVDFRNKTINILQQKTKKLNLYPINSALYRVLREYVKNHKIKHRLFPVTESAVMITFHRLSKLADIHNCTFHTLRHTFASLLNLSNVDLKTIQELLGHTTLSTTSQYLHTLPQHKRKAVEVIANIIDNKPQTV